MFSYTLLRAIVLFFRFLPFSILYFLSSILYFLFFYLIRFRRKQVQKDLKLSFPEKNKKELHAVEKAIYLNMTFVFCESLKSLSMTEKDFKHHVSFKNIEYLKDLKKRKKSSLIYLAHYGNWEWLVSLSIKFPTGCVNVYKRIHNRRIDDFFLYRRTYFGASMIDVKKFPRYMANLIREKTLKDQSYFFFMNADQKPRDHQESIELNFLNRRTKFLLGPEKVARYLDLEMIYLKIKRKKLGFYEVSFTPFGNPGEKPLGALTESLVKQLETDILEDPSPWFWLHNRWKK